jgi:hypothetical protein
MKWSYAFACFWFSKSLLWPAPFLQLDYPLAGSFWRLPRRIRRRTPPLVRRCSRWFGKTHSTPNAPLTPQSPAPDGLLQSTSPRPPRASSSANGLQNESNAEKFHLRRTYAKRAHAVALRSRFLGWRRSRRCRFRRRSRRSCRLDRIGLVIEPHDILGDIRSRGPVDDRAALRGGVQDGG